MPTGKAQAESQPIFELKSLANIVVLDPCAREQRHAHPASMYGLTFSPANSYTNTGENDRLLTLACLSPSQ